MYPEEKKRCLYKHGGHVETHQRTSVSFQHPDHKDSGGSLTGTSGCRAQLQSRVEEPV